MSEQKCVTCGHNNVDRHGFCKYEIPHPKALYGNYPKRYCGCKCSFSEAEQKVTAGDCLGRFDENSDECTKCGMSRSAHWDSPVSAGEGVPESDLIKCPACNMTVARSSDASKEYVRGLKDALAAVNKHNARYDDNYQHCLYKCIPEAIEALISQHSPEVKINDKNT